MWRLALVFGLWAGGSVAQDYVFEWQGGGGYSMRGAVSFETGAGKGILTEAHVQCFEIEGFLGDQSVGRWALGMLTERTSWQVMFDPATNQFVTAGPTLGISQAWNMNGRGDDCGAGGFGFNLGSYAQDLCLDNSLIVASQVPPSTPFPAREVSGHTFSSDACIGPMIMSRAGY